MRGRKGEEEKNNGWVGKGRRRRIMEGRKGEEEKNNGREERGEGEE